MICQQVHHQITLLMPEIKENIGIGNILFQEHIEKQKCERKWRNYIIQFIRIISIISEEQLFMLISLYSINNANCFFPTKLVEFSYKTIIIFIFQNR